MCRFSEGLEYQNRLVPYMNRVNWFEKDNSQDKEKGES